MGIVHKCVINSKGAMFYTWPIKIIFINCTNEYKKLFFVKVELWIPLSLWIVTTILMTMSAKATASCVLAFVLITLQRKFTTVHKVK